MALTKKGKERKKPGPAKGSPYKMTPEIIGKLEQAFSIDATISEACFYAGIDDSTYYLWKKQNPEQFKHLEALRNTPILAARQTLTKAVQTDSDMALKYLERKRRDEFGRNLDLTSKGEQLGIELTPEQSFQLIRARANRSNTQ